MLDSGAVASSSKRSDPKSANVVETLDSIDRIDRNVKWITLKNWHSPLPQRCSWRQNGTGSSTEREQ